MFQGTPQSETPPRPRERLLYAVRGRLWQRGLELDTGLQGLLLGRGVSMLKATLLLERGYSLTTVAAVTNYHERNSLKQQKCIISHRNSGGRKSEIEVLGGSRFLQRP